MSACARISVVIPCHNYGRFLAEAVSSVEHQTRLPDEIVIIDDGSSDETPEVIAGISMRRPDIVSIRRSPAQGAASTFTDGVRASTGSLVVILSADDRLSPRYLELTELALESSEAGFAYTGAHLFGATERWVPAPRFNRNALMRRNLVNGSAMFRRALFERVGGWRSDLGGMEDWEFWVHAVAVGFGGVAVDGCWIEYRRHGGLSRNMMSSAGRIASHVRVWALHPRTVRMRNLAAWAGGAALRTMKGRFPAPT